MKKIILVFVLLFGFLTNQAQAQAQVQTDSIGEYAKQLIIVNLKNEKELPMSEQELSILNDQKQYDSLIQQKIVKFFAIEENCLKMIEDVMRDMDTIPNLLNKIDEKEIIETIKDEFDDYLSIESIAKLDTLNLGIKTKIKINGAKYPE